MSNNIKIKGVTKRRETPAICGCCFLFIIETISQGRFINAYGYHFSKLNLPIYISIELWYYVVN